MGNFHIVILGWIILSRVLILVNGGEVWPLERPEGMPTIQSLEVMCGKDHMDVHMQFSQPFEGIVSSKGQYGDPRCVYVPPSTGKTYFQFRIAYAKCGTKPDLNGQFYENTVVVQYDKDLLEVWDEAKRLRCEWYNDYEKTASKPPMVIADLDIIQLDFRGDNVDCWMEIQHGKGPWAPPVSGIVPLGSTLTLVVAINDYRGEFDMRVKSCAASDGGGHIIQLSDEHGCVLRPKMISRFLKARISDERASVITYGFFHAFKFPDALSVHVKCKVEICRHGCLDHCQLADSAGSQPPPSHHPSPHTPSFGDYNTLERKDTDHKDTKSESLSDPFGDLIYDDRLGLDSIEEISTEKSIQYSPLIASKEENKISLKNPELSNNNPSLNDINAEQEILPEASPIHRIREHGERFPHGPRSLKDDTIRMIMNNSTILNSSKETNGTTFSSMRHRRRRSFVISDSKTSNANVGVSGLYEVVSEADLAFTPDNKAEPVTVFHGKIREEVVYGICLPVHGFSVMFILMSVSVITSALVAGFLMQRYRIQKKNCQILQQNSRSLNTNNIIQTTATELAVNSLASWMALRLIKTTNHHQSTATIQNHATTNTNHKS